MAHGHGLKMTFCSVPTDFEMDQEEYSNFTFKGEKTFSNAKIVSLWSYRRQILIYQYISIFLIMSHTNTCQNLHDSLTHK